MSANDKTANAAPESTDPWATTASAFGSAHVVEDNSSAYAAADQPDATHTNTDDGSYDHEQGLAAGEGEYPSEDSVRAAKPKPNYAMLAMAGVVGLAILGGTGAFVKQKFFGAKPGEFVSPQAAQVNTINPASAQAAPVSAFEASAAVSANKPSGDVFDSPSSAASAASLPTAAAVGVTAATAANTALAKSVEAKYDAPAATVPAKPAVAMAAPVDVAPANVTVSDKAVKTPKAPATEKVAVAEPVKGQPKVAVKAAAKPKKYASATKAKSRTQRQSTRLAKKSSKVKVAKAATGVGASGSEMFVLGRGMKVKSIFPQSGPNAQAWVADGSGRVEVVRVGDTLKGGSQVLAIIGEKGQVVTTGGTISTQGAR